MHFFLSEFETAFWSASFMFDQNHKIKNINNQMVIAAIYLEKSISLTGLECGD